MSFLWFKSSKEKIKAEHERQVSRLWELKSEQLFEILDAGHVSPDFHVDSNHTLLIEAIDLNEFDMAEGLLTRGANVNLPAENGRTPLSWAISERFDGGEHVMVSLLLQHGADVEQVSNYATPLMRACSRDYLLNVATLLIERGAKVNAQNANDSSALKAAIANKLPLTVKLLLEHGADHTLRDNNAKTALQFAHEESPECAAVIEHHLLQAVSLEALSTHASTDKKSARKRL